MSEKCGLLVFPSFALSEPWILRKLDFFRNFERILSALCNLSDTFSASVHAR